MLGSGVTAVPAHTLLVVESQWQKLPSLGMFTSPAGKSSAHRATDSNDVLENDALNLEGALGEKRGSESLTQLSQHVKLSGKSCQHLPVHNTTQISTRLQVLFLKIVTPGINEACNQGPAPQACERTSLHLQSPIERQTNKLRDRPRLFLDE